MDRVHSSARKLIAAAAKGHRFKSGRYILFYLFYFIIFGIHIFLIFDILFSYERKKYIKYI